MFRVVFNFRYTFPGDLFCNIDIIDQVQSPVTIIHGTRDEVVPFWHGERLFELCPQDWRCKPLWVTGAGHNNVEAYLKCVSALVHRRREWWHVLTHSLTLAIPV